MTKSKLLLFPFLLVFFEIGCYLSNDMYVPALPNISTDLNITQHEAQLTLTLWFIGAACFQLLAGPLTDRFGRKPLVIISGFIYVLASLTCAISQDLTLLLIARFIQGVTISTAIVAGYSSIHELYDQRQAIRILAIMGSIIILAPAFGPLVGSIVLYATDWRGIFWIITAWGVLATLLLLKWMPETHPIENRHPIKLNNLLKHYGSIIYNWQFSGTVLVFCFTFAGFIAWITSGPFIVINLFQQTALVFGLLQAVIFASYMIANHLVEHLMKKIGIQRLIEVGLSITLVGGILIAVLTTLFPNYLSVLIISMTIFSFGSGFIFAPLNRLAIEASTEPMGLRMAVLSAYMTAFGSLGSILGSVFYNNTTASFGYIVGSLVISAWIIRRSLNLHSATKV